MTKIGNIKIGNTDYKLGESDTGHFLGNYNKWAKSRTINTVSGSSTINYSVNSNDTNFSVTSYAAFWLFDNIYYGSPMLITTNGTFIRDSSLYIENTGSNLPRYGWRITDVTDTNNTIIYTDYDGISQYGTIYKRNANGTFSVLSTSVILYDPLPPDHRLLNIGDTVINNGKLYTWNPSGWKANLTDYVRSDSHSHDVTVRLPQYNAANNVSITTNVTKGTLTGSITPTGKLVKGYYDTTNSIKLMDDIPDYGPYKLYYSEIRYTKPEKFSRKMTNVINGYSEYNISYISYNIGNDSEHICSAKYSYSTHSLDLIPVNTYTYNIKIPNIGDTYVGIFGELVPLTSSGNYYGDYYSSYSYDSYTYGYDTYGYGYIDPNPFYIVTSNEYIDKVIYPVVECEPQYTYVHFEGTSNQSVSISGSPSVSVTIPTTEKILTTTQVQIISR